MQAHAEAKERLRTALEIKDARPEEAVAALRDIVFGDLGSDQEVLRLKESAIEQLVSLYVKLKNAEKLRDLLTELRPLFAVVPKAKTAKLVRLVIDSLSQVPGSNQLQLEVCKEQLEWARAEKRTFLRQHLELRLATQYVEAKDYPSALALIATLLSEVKRLDDKLLLVNIHLLESRVHHALRNVPKAKAALTAAKTAANAIYIPPALQAEIDSRSGVLNAEEKDYKTAYSYFFEAFEQLNGLDDPRAVISLKHMLMCRIMMGNADSVASIISSKAGLKYMGESVDAMSAVAKAYQERSLSAFQQALVSFKSQLQDDPIVNNHLQALYENLLEQNLCRIIEPFSFVEISHVARLIALPESQVEQKLSQLILDKKVRGTLDQGAGVLEVFEEEPEDKLYPRTLDIIDNVSRVIDTLFVRSQKLVV